jgi:hypothetical protein
LSAGLFLEKGNIDIAYTKIKDACQGATGKASIFAGFWRPGQNNCAVWGCALLCGQVQRGLRRGLRLQLVPPSALPLTCRTKSAAYRITPMRPWISPRYAPTRCLFKANMLQIYHYSIHQWRHPQQRLQRSIYIASP